MLALTDDIAVRAHTHLPHSGEVYYTVARERRELFDRIVKHFHENSPV